MDPEEIDKVVLPYLDKRGFKQAGLALQQEKQQNSKGSNTSSTAQIDPDIARQILSFSEVDGPAQYQDGYNKLRSWAYSSLDQCQVAQAKMPWKPVRHRRSFRHRLLTFSPFFRSMAMYSCSKKAKRRLREVELKTKDFPSSTCNGPVNNGRDKIEVLDCSDDEDFEGVVQADFVFFDPKPSDFHGVKVLLQTYLDSKQWDLSGFTDLILEQSTVGTVVKIENDEDDGIYSVVTVLNLERYKGSKCMTEIKDYLLKVCQGTDAMAKLKPLVGESVQGVGIIVSQRVVNLPSQLLPSLYDALFDEVSWATEDEPTEELRNSFRFKIYIVISKVYKHKNADQIKGSTKSGDEAMIYVKPEDEILLKLSSWSLCFPLHAEQVTTNELINYRLMGLLMAVEASKVSMFRSQLHLLIDEQ